MCVFLANYVPKCQMSSGPYGQIFSFAFMRILNHPTTPLLSTQLLTPPTHPHAILLPVYGPLYVYRGKFVCQGRIQDLIRGGPDRYRPKLPMVRSSIVQVKRALFSVGSGACLRALEALGYFITKYAFSPFWGTFLYYF